LVHTEPESEQRVDATASQITVAGDRYPQAEADLTRR
jgi:hypothetical protein